MLETVQPARGGIRVQDIAVQILDEDCIRGTLENCSEEALALLEVGSIQLSFHGPAMITMGHRAVNGWERGQRGLNSGTDV
jgi:hypothetical protein